jgi:hypothetical protein
VLEGDREGYVDLKDLAAELRDRAGGTDIGTAAQALLDELNSPSAPLVSHERHQSAVAWPTGEYIDLDGATGVSIYMPLGESDSDLARYLPNHLDLANNTLWDDFLFAYVALFPPQGGGETGRGNDPTPGSLRHTIYLPLLVRD